MPARDWLLLPGMELPGVKVRRHKSRTAKGVSVGTMKARLWKAARDRLGMAFDVDHIAAVAEANYDAAQRFVLGLERCGYLKVIGSKALGEVGPRKTFLLVEDTGPHAPHLRRDGSLFDPNRGHWVYPLADLVAAKRASPGQRRKRVRRKAVRA